MRDKYFKCKECGNDVLCFLANNLDTGQSNWEGECDNCGEVNFSKEDKNLPDVRFCPLCGIQFDEKIQANKKIRCGKCGYKFKVVVPDEL